MPGARPRSVKNFFGLLLMLEFFVIGVFAATDVFLFYVLFEAMLVPMYFIIGGFGGPRRQYAAMKFFLYSLLGGLLMLAAVIGLYVTTGAHSFAIQDLIGKVPNDATQKWLFLGFFIAFAIKAPLVPFHTWLPDAGAEAPAGGARAARRRARQGRHVRLPALLPAAVPGRLALLRAGHPDPGRHRHPLRGVPGDRPARHEAAGRPTPRSRTSASSAWASSRSPPRAARARCSTWSTTACRPVRCSSSSAC